ncbi:DUF317 domain-containing protein [Streptomyces bacillaris]
MLPVPLKERQLAGFADKQASQIPFETGPRHLAGPGDVRHVTHGLAAAGWTTLSDPLSAEIVLRSSDLRHSLQFDPQSVTSAWWRLWAEHTDDGPGWYAEFGELVPAEVLTGFTDALVAPPLPPQDPWQAVDSAGWHRESERAARSPDSMCHIELRRLSGSPDRLSWLVDTREAGHGEFVGPRIWHAHFDELTPTHLISSFLTALADPSPLLRGMYERCIHHSAVQKPSALRPQQVVGAHITRINSLRAQAPSGLPQQPKPASTAGKTTSTRPAAHR